MAEKTILLKLNFLDTFVILFDIVFFEQTEQNQIHPLAKLGVGFVCTGLQLIFEKWPILNIQKCYKIEGLTQFKAIDDISFYKAKIEQQYFIISIITLLSLFGHTVSKLIKSSHEDHNCFKQKVKSVIQCTPRVLATMWRCANDNRVASNGFK